MNSAIYTLSCNLFFVSRLVAALASAATKSFAICSKAFIKLETLESLTAAQRQKYEELGLEVFIK